MRRHRRRTQRALTVALFSSHYYIPSIPSFPPLAFHVHRVVQVPMQFVFSTFFYREFYSSHSAPALSAAALSSSKNLLFVLGKIWSSRGGTQHVEQAGCFFFSYIGQKLYYYHADSSLS